MYGFSDNLARRFERVLQQIFRGIQNRPGEAILQRSPEQRHLRRLQDREVDPLGLDMQVRLRQKYDGYLFLNFSHFLNLTGIVS